MTTTPSPEAIEFLRKPNPAVMATLAKDGRPVAVATWYLLEDDGRILVNLDAERVRLAHLRRDPRFALDVIDGENWYTHVSLQLEVDEIRDDDGFAGIDALSRHYGGRPYPDHERPRVDVRARILRASGWGAFQGE
ncbi:TIGR03618 family F420-dependent PPOX class oxidoreductase [Agrococcus sp. SL85]|uniref:TIGR03618 family F420-dependent PPOX class oxidoreductase n=1 Tax=Agrococcus sp. SL85 TaxID=2995141 RepID=UPI00226CFF5E|nr:TIGR03618 family F420-dependent PPOX class oxidoreductase [Agrococcus sp. SL85]WAC67120.1 TIGR03618 family F420-dependent PPOX class oxidoreductase [Agrococcus sp. SL85]